jgi:hypothetical protein
MVLSTKLESEYSGQRQARARKAWRGGTGCSIVRATANWPGDELGRPGNEARVAIDHKTKLIRVTCDIVDALLLGDSSLRTHPPTGTTTPVRDDWETWLPEAEFKVFTGCVKRLEPLYVMLSISLNEALELRQAGRLPKAYQAICITPSLCTLLTQPLSGLLRSMLEHAKHFAVVPNLVPLNPKDFHGVKSQRVARMNGLLNRVLLTHRSQFLYKISTMEELVEDLDKDFHDAAEELAGGCAFQPYRYWETLDETHFDLNTCLRETFVVLKCFLLALPEKQLAPFQATVFTQLQSRRPAYSLSQRLNRHGRMAAVRGE